MKTLLANFLLHAGRSSSKQGHFAKNDSLLVGNTFPKPNECSAGAAVVGTLLYSFLDLVMQVNDSYMDIRYQPTETEATMPEDWKTNYFPSYIPDGYTLAQHVSDENFGFLEYRNEQGERMEIHIGGKGAGINLNSKGAEIDHVSLHNTVATVLYQSSGSVDLVWSYGDQYFVVEACDYATAYAVAQGLKIIWK